MPPENFDFACQQDWPEWKARFLRYRIATKLNQEDGEVQVASLVYSLGKHAENIVKSFTFEDNADSKDFDKVLKKFDEHFIPKRNVIYERACFHKRNQQAGETVESFVRALYELSEHCQFHDKDEMIRDRIVIGILDKTVSEKLQLTADLTLKMAVDTARQSELVKLQMKDVNSDLSVDALRLPAPHRRSYKSHKMSPKQHHSSTPAKSKNCQRCGKGPHSNENCPAKNKSCNKCGKIGHFYKCCWTKQIRAVQNEDSTPTDTISGLNQLFLGSILVDDRASDEWTVILKLHGSEAQFKIDTGADTTIISKAAYDQLINPPVLKAQNNTRLLSPGGPLPCIGQFMAEARYKDTVYHFPIFVVEKNITNLLGRAVAQKIGLVM